MVFRLNALTTREKSGKEKVGITICGRHCTQMSHVKTDIYALKEEEFLVVLGKRIFVGGKKNQVEVWNYLFKF